MAQALIIYSIFAFFGGIASLIKASKWKSSGEAALCTVKELLNYTEKKVKKQMVYTCNFTVEHSSNYGVWENRLSKEFTSLEEANAFVGTQFIGAALKNGKFISEEDYENLRKGWKTQLISSVVCFAIAIGLIALVSNL